MLSGNLREVRCPGVRHLPCAASMQRWWGSFTWRLRAEICSTCGAATCLQ